MRRDIAELDDYQGDRRKMQLVLAPEVTGTREMTVFRVEMEPYAQTSMHVHEGVELMYYLAGRGEMSMGEEIIEVGPDVAVLAEKGLVHQLRNGAEPMTLLCIYVPPVPTSFIESNYVRVPKQKS
ncbi:MAG: cupin domain-containing protein [Chloroflexota bacterium]